MDITEFSRRSSIPTAGAIPFTGESGIAFDGTMQHELPHGTLAASRQSQAVRWTVESTHSEFKSTPIAFEVLGVILGSRSGSRDP